MWRATVPRSPRRKPPWRAIPPRPNTTESDAARYAELAKAGAGLASRNPTRSAPAPTWPANPPAPRQAGIESAKAALDSDVAAVAAAKLNLNYCEIRAPISGRTGNLLVHAGNLVKANDVPLVVIHQVSPIFVNFNVPEQHLAAIRRLNAAHRLAVSVFAQDDPDPRSSGSALRHRQHRRYRHRHHPSEGHLR